MDEATLEQKQIITNITETKIIHNWSALG